VGLAAVLSHHPVFAQGATAADSTAATSEGQHDFDFEIGTWVMHRRRLLRPLTGSNDWVTTDGDRHIVRKVWAGRASLAELEVDSPTPHFVGSILHLFNPQTGQWSLYWASTKDGSVAAPMIGQFKKGRGEFFDQETVHGAAILVRVTYSDITPTSFRTERAFSDDWGKTWETNSIDIYARQQ